MSKAKCIPSQKLRCTWGAFKSVQVLQCESPSVEYPSVMTHLGSSGPGEVIQVYKIKWVHRNLKESGLDM